MRWRIRSVERKGRLLGGWETWWRRGGGGNYSAICVVWGGDGERVVQVAFRIDIEVGIGRR